MRRLVLFVFFSAFSFLTYSQNFVTEDGKAVFTSKAPLNEFDGVSQKLHGLVDLDKNLVYFYLDLNTLDTGIGLRDRHMRENYLETDKYPFAEFTGKMLTVPDLDSGDWVAVEVEGIFKIHGKEKQIQIPGMLKKEEKGLVKLQADFEVLLGDFDIEIPKLVFYELAEKQLVHIEADLKLQN